MALTSWNRKNSGVNSVELERRRLLRRLTGKIAALTALNWNRSSVNGVCLLCKCVDGV